MMPLTVAKTQLTGSFYCSKDAVGRAAFSPLSPTPPFFPLHSEEGKIALVTTLLVSSINNSLRVRVCARI